MNVKQRQAAADPQMKSTDLGCDYASRLLQGFLERVERIFTLSVSGGKLHIFKSCNA